MKLIHQLLQFKPLMLVKTREIIMELCACVFLNLIWFNADRSRPWTKLYVPNIIFSIFWLNFSLPTQYIILDLLLFIIIVILNKYFGHEGKFTKKALWVYDWHPLYYALLPFSHIMYQEVLEGLVCSKFGQFNFRAL